MIIDFNKTWYEIRKDIDRCSGLLAEMIADPQNKENKKLLKEKFDLCVEF